MRGAPGPFSYIDMGGMFTVLKVRDRPRPSDATSWYRHPRAPSPAQPIRGGCRRMG
jgi:manganese oxidase